MRYWVGLVVYVYSTYFILPHIITLYFPFFKSKDVRAPTYEYRGFYIGLEAS